MKLLRILAAALMAFALSSPVAAQQYPSPTFNNVTAIGTLSLPNVPLSVSSGGTGGATQSAARTGLGLGTAATQNTGTSGATVPLLNGANTWSSNQTFTGGKAAIISGAAATGRNLYYQTAGIDRWAIFADSSPESGSNAGTNLNIARFSDAGAFIDNPLTITRSTGSVGIADGLAMGTNAPITFAGTGAATTRTNLGAAASGANSDITSLSGLTTALSVGQGGTGVTTSTGSGSTVRSTSPTLVTPVLGTPTSVTLTNGTGLPLTSGVTGVLPIANGGTNSATGAFIKVKRVVFTSSGTFTPDAGLLYANTICIGGGGGAGGVAASAANQATTSGGGGAGAVVEVISTAATIGASQTVTIGAAGPGGAAGANTGTAGGTTSLGAICSAAGGSPSTGAGATGLSPGGAGATTGTGDVIHPGENGENGGSTTSSAVLSVAGGNGGSNGYGAGGLGGVNAAGGVGHGYGAGGGGSASSNTGAAAAGGAGTAGAVIIVEYLNQ